MGFPTLTGRPYHRGSVFFLLDTSTAGWHTTARDLRIGADRCAVLIHRELETEQDRSAFEWDWIRSSLRTRRPLRRSIRNGRYPHTRSIRLDIRKSIRLTEQEVNDDAKDGSWRLRPPRHYRSLQGGSEQVPTGAERCECTREDSIDLDSFGLFP